MSDLTDPVTGDIITQNQWNGRRESAYQEACKAVDDANDKLKKAALYGVQCDLTVYPQDDTMSRRDLRPAPPGTVKFPGVQRTQSGPIYQQIRVGRTPK